MIDLEEITGQFSIAYDDVNDRTKDKAILQKKMFEAFTEQITATRVLAQRLVPLDEFEGEVDDQNIIQFIAEWYPGWRLAGYRDAQIVLEEDPSLLKYEYVNQPLGMVFGRTTVEGGPSLDEKELQENNPKLWQEITEWPQPWAGLLATMLYNECNGITPKEAELSVAIEFGNYGINRVLTDPSTWTDDQMERVKFYMRPGKITTRLLSPRAAKDEELDEI